MAHKHKYTIVVSRKDNSTELRCSVPGCDVTIIKVNKKNR